MRRLRPLSPPLPNRDGTTLTEVLMAILCMGIGVVAVASLFPIALLRSVQATQLTSGTILRYNAETFVDVNPSVVFDPDVDSNATEHFSTNYLVDPLGWNILNVDAGATQANSVGNMARFNVGIGSEAAAENFVTLPDSWITVHEDVPTGNNDNSVTLDVAIPEDVYNTATTNDDIIDGLLNRYDSDGDGVIDQDMLRLVLFSVDENLSEVRYIKSLSQISGTTIGWPTTGTNAQTPLPDNGQYRNNNVSRVRIEVRERRSTWMLNVRNFTVDPSVPQALVDVVIFFRRAPSVEDETTFNLTFVVPRTYSVGVAGDKPKIKKGSFMLDTDTGAWHRIQKVDETTDPYRITLEKNSAGSLGGHTVAFMQGVIDVYPLGSKP
ncbi:MAG: hypothetical protein KDA84_27070 [Planctomycetaceae bacterium]|nr:hypothetical protein [Planctomycetaceae bacterium]